MRTVDGLGYSLGGLDLNGTDDAGVDWLVFDVEDWDSRPATTGQVLHKPFSHGGWMTPAEDQKHVMRLTGRLQAGDRVSGSEGARQFNRVLPMYDAAVLARSMDGVTHHRRVRVYGVPKIVRPSNTYATYDVIVEAPDPRKLGGDGSTPYQHSATAFLPSTSGGLQIPLQLPFQIAASVVSGSVTVEAVGDASPPVLVRINGPATQPTIRDEMGGAMPLDITLSAGQWLDVDLDARTIKINSTVNRRNLLRGPWITPRPGMALSLDAAVYNPATSMTVFWTDASY